MDSGRASILSEVLLELTLAIGSETDYKKIVKKTISLWLRRINCVSGALLMLEDDEVVLEYIIPTYLKNMVIPELFIDYIRKEKIDFYRELREKDQYYYIFPLSSNQFFVFLKNTRLSHSQCSELYPVTQFFGNTLEKEKEKVKRLAIEKQLDQEKRLLRTVIDHLPDAIYLKDLDLKKVITNKADLETIGIECEFDVLGKRDTDVFPEEIASKFEAIDRSIIDSGIPIIDNVSEYLNKNGKKGWLQESKFPFKDGNGNIVGVFGVSRDITAKKEVQEKIKRLSLVASQSTNGVIITNLEGRVEWINSGFTRLTGYTAEEMIGKKPGDVLQGADSDPEVMKIMSDAIKNFQPFEVDLINYKKDGTPYNIKIACNPLKDDQGQVKGFMAIESDITEKIKYRNEILKAKQIAEKAQEAEKAFLANMSHEIRTPLNAIIGMTSLLKETDNSAEQLDYIETLDQSSRFLLRLISDILDIAKIESGKIEVRNNDFNLHKCLKSIQHTFQLKSQHKDLNVKLLWDASLPEFVNGDEVLLQQVLNNLVSNAEKFTEKGAITLIVNMSEQMEEGMLLEFEIIDTGVGMSEQDQKQIFHKFKQVESSKVSIHKGTGLGLCITKEIVELLGGHISLSSDVGKGTTFRFSMPFTKSILQLTKKDRILQKLDMDTDYDVKNDRVLIVEDNLINQKYITRLMEKMSISYDVANNGQEALEMSDKAQYGIIFMDIQMPILDGYEATRLIRNSKNINQDTPIVALTASAMLDQKNKALEYGMNDYLSKPFTPEQLKEKLKVAI